MPYLMRWQIEEYFSFKKQQFELKYWYQQFPAAKSLITADNSV